MDNKHGAILWEPVTKLRSITRNQEGNGHLIRVVVADDSPVTRSALCNLLMDECDIEVVDYAQDGKEAVQKARQLQPDVLVTDIQMPMLDGTEAVRILRAENSHMKFIALSPFGETDDITTAIEAGANAVLLKDTAPMCLPNAVRAVHLGGIYHRWCVWRDKQEDNS